MQLTNDLPPLPSYRQKGALEALQDATSMTETTYIADTILAYLQSGSFFWLVFMVLVYKLGSQHVKGK
jgi:hypothetical protein